MFKKTFVTVILLSGFAFGQNPSLQSLQLRLNQMRPSMKALVQNLMKKRLQNTLYMSMKNGGFAEEEIQKVMLSKKFKQHQQEVLKDTKVQASINELLDRTLNAQALIDRLNAQKKQFHELQQKEFQDALMAYIQHQHDEGERAKPSKTLASRLGEWLKQKALN